MFFYSKFKSKPILAKVSFNNKDFNLSTDMRQTKVKEEIKEWIQKIHYLVKYHKLFNIFKGKE